MTTRTTFHGIQLLRGLTACLVVLAHVNLVMGHADQYGATLLPVRLSGMFAVGVFFAISGFIIAVVSLDSAWRGSISRLHYFSKRFIRIVPFMWLCIIGYNLLSAAGTRQIEWAPFLRALSLWPVGELKPNVVWSLQHEALFYLLFALSFLGARRRPWLLALWFIAPILYAGFLATGLWPGPIRQQPFVDLANLVLLGGFSGANLQFGVGFLLGLAYLKHGPQGAPLFNRPMPTIGVILILLVACAMVEWTDFPIRGLGRMIAWSLMAGGILWSGIIMAAPKKPGLGFRLAMLLGDASFAIYLVHSAVLMVALAITHRFSSIAYTFPGITLAAIVCLCVVVGVITHLLVERPLIGWLARGRRVTIWQPPEADAP